MLEVHSIYATVRQPKNGDTAQVTTGYYTLADGVLTMTDSKGAPVRRMLSGEKILHKTKSGDNERSIAGRLTLEIYYMLRGGAAQTSGFNRSLNYQPSGVA
jgi:hypothetical protein